MEFKRQTEDLDSSFDSLSDEISDEWSPNSILDYSTVGSQEGNVLLNNKGKIRDLRNFKLELVEIFSKHELTKNALTPVSFEGIYSYRFEIEQVELLLPRDLSAKSCFRP